MTPTRDRKVPAAPGLKKKSMDRLPKKAKRPETRKMPKVASIAFSMLEDEYARKVNALALDTLDAMGLKQTDGWRIYPKQGLAVLEAAPEKPS